MPGGGDDPGTRGVWNSGGMPLVESRDKCLLCILFREFEIAKQRDESSYNPAPIGAVNGFDGRRDVHIQVFYSSISFSSGGLSIRARPVRLSGEKEI
jgi:hypothetical protein